MDIFGSSILPPSASTGISSAQSSPIVSPYTPLSSASGTSAHLFPPQGVPSDVDGEQSELVSSSYQFADEFLWNTDSNAYLSFPSDVEGSADTLGFAFDGEEFDLTQIPTVGMGKFNFDMDIDMDVESSQH
jgi:hypothetical protein